MEYIRELGTLLEVKICDLRANLYTQCTTSADRGIHLGGSQSAIAPMAALFFGGHFRYDTVNPTTEDQDIFLLSKGHAVAALASVYAEAGYIPESALLNSRGWGAQIKGHPGPVIPGVPVATGPLGHGIGVACGYAYRQKERGNFNTYVLVGDGELQEGSCWESLLFAAKNKLSNLCVLVDKNNGQSDSTQKLLMNFDDLGQRFEAWGFNVLTADMTNIPGLLTCLESFTACRNDVRPTVIICESYKGYGGYSVNANKHKATVGDAEGEMERAFLNGRRQTLIHSLNFMDLSAVKFLTEKLDYRAEFENEKLVGLIKNTKPPRVKRVAVRGKKLIYNEGSLPVIEKGQKFASTDLAAAFASVFAESDNFYTIDADLSNVSGLYTGTARTNITHAINAGIAECHMMNMAEGLAAVGANVWVSTFGPFFNIQAFRRISVSCQEREEAIALPDGWLSDGHNLDITFLSTASNIDTGVNGATHMSNDDANIISQLAHVKVIDVSCPRQFLAAAKWIAEGGKGLVYLRVQRYGEHALYGSDYQFEFGKGFFVKGSEASPVFIISSGHGVYEAISAAESLESDGITAAVIDMPSYDGLLLKKLTENGGKLLFAEQNNGWIFDCFSRDCLQNHYRFDSNNIHRMSARDKSNKAQFIQSGTYDQILNALELSPKDIADYVKLIMSRE